MSVYQCSCHQSMQGDRDRIFKECKHTSSPLVRWGWWLQAEHLTFSATVETRIHLHTENSICPCLLAALRWLWALLCPNFFPPQVFAHAVPSAWNLEHSFSDSGLSLRHPLYSLLRYLPEHFSLVWSFSDADPEMRI